VSRHGARHAGHDDHRVDVGAGPRPLVGGGAAVDADADERRSERLLDVVDEPREVALEARIGGRHRIATLPRSLPSRKTSLDGEPAGR
jgi:hypothetical protein